MRRTTALIAVLLATAMALAACGGTATDAAQLERVPVSRVEQLVADPPAGMVVLDIRTPEEYAAGHLAGAVNIDYYAADFADRLAELDPTVPYVMYCNSGNRSANALPLMDQIGFKQVYEMEGGIVAWYQAGLPLES
jgi:phage shock protein E